MVSYDGIELILSNVEQVVLEVINL